MKLAIASGCLWLLFFAALVYVHIAAPDDIRFMRQIHPDAYFKLLWRSGLYLLVFSILPVRWAYRYHQAQRSEKLGLCPKCGYDRRATPARCPECGTEKPKE